MRIAFIPIDDRPVCYTLPQQICAIDKSIELLMPPREWLGNLTKTADTDKILKWIDGLPEVDAFVVSLDTIAYGGLIPSRRSTDSFEQIRARLERLRSVIPQNTYAFSSIMRISNNNINQEEKEYWKDWGKKIFEYSFNCSKSPLPLREGVRGWGIPEEILQDYLATRKRNFEINKLYLDWDLRTLVFSKDDCAEYGFNVDEAQELAAAFAQKQRSLNTFQIRTGADEIPLTLLARALAPQLKIKPVFLEPEHKHLISNYEDVSIEESVRGQIELAGCKVSDNADLLLYVNNFVDRQGEIVMGVDTAPFSGVWEKPDKPYMIADVRFANGADNAFVEQLLAAGVLGCRHETGTGQSPSEPSAGNPLDENFYGYSAWNTSANTLGSLICAAAVKFRAKKYDDEAFKRLQAVRFLDDWAYQANLRQQKSGEWKNFEDKIFNHFGVRPSKYSYPWNRKFEIEITI
jgi:hypothetical protein